MRRRLAAVVVAVAVLGGVPAGADPVRFRIDPAASELTFKATSRLVNADGRFHRFAGEVVADPANLAAGRVSLTIDAASIDTDNVKRDNHLRSGDFFDVAAHPHVVFESLRVVAGSPMTIVGRLTMRGVTREVAVPGDVRVDADGLVARGEVTVRRSEFGMTYQSVLNPVGDEVRVRFILRGRPQPSPGQRS